MAWIYIIFSRMLQLPVISSSEYPSTFFLQTLITFSASHVPSGFLKNLIILKNIWCTWIQALHYGLNHENRWKNWKMKCIKKPVCVPGHTSEVKLLWQTVVHENFKVYMNRYVNFVWTFPGGGRPHVRGPTQYTILYPTPTRNRNGNKYPYVSRSTYLNRILII